MTILITGSGLITDKYSLSGNTATTVLNRDSETTIAQIRCVNRTTGTQTLTIDVYDGTNTYYLRNSLAMASKEAVVIDGPIVLANDEALRVTSGAAGGDTDVFVSYFNPVASGRQ